MTNKGIFSNMENVCNTESSSTKTQRIVEKNMQKEQRLLKKGWRWVKVDGTLQVFVPCDKDGKPTQEGERKIKLRKEILETY